MIDSLWALGNRLKEEDGVDTPFDALNLLPELKRALILHRGALTPEFQYLQEFL